jgi:BMFP domain-containing protein YqiC
MTDVEALTQRVAALEAQLAQTAKAPAKAVKRPSAKKTL